MANGNKDAVSAEFYVSLAREHDLNRGSNSSLICLARIETLKFSTNHSKRGQQPSRILLKKSCASDPAGPHMLSGSLQQAGSLAIIDDRERRHCRLADAARGPRR